MSHTTNEAKILPATGIEKPAKFTPSRKNRDRAPVKRKRAKNGAHSSHSASWHRRFEELRTFYRREHHSDVPSPYPENPGLSRWVKRQRWEYALYSSGDTSARAMTPDRIVRLMTVNFTWNLHERSWEKAYAALLRFKEEHGHTNVPSDYKDTHLAQWVRHQRLQIRRYNSSTEKSHITPDRMQRLYDIGFSCDFAVIAHALRLNKSIYPLQKTLTIPAPYVPNDQRPDMWQYAEEHMDETNSSLGQEEDNSSSINSRGNQKPRRPENLNNTLPDGGAADAQESIHDHPETNNEYSWSVSEENEEAANHPLQLVASTGIDDGDDASIGGGGGDDEDDSSLFSVLAELTKQGDMSDDDGVEIV